MGEVFRARDTRLGREVAVKLLPQEFWADPDRLRRFEQEARAAAALNHPNILSVHDIGTADGVPYFVCELLSGETLQARLERGPLGVDQVADYGAQVARGLATAHDRGIVHRIGATYALLGDTRQAVSWLKKASREGLPCYPLFERDPTLDSLRQDPEFVAFMQQLKSQAEQFRSTL